MVKINRNDACPCGSGKKYKKCCIDKPEENKIVSSQSAMNNFNLHWSEEKISPMTNAQIFEKLGALGIELDEEKFIEHAARTVSSEKIAKLLEKESGIEIAGYDADFPWIAMNILWDRLIPARRCIEIIYRYIDDGYGAYDENDFDGAFEFWNSAWNSIVKTFSPLTKDFGYVDSHYQGYDIDLFEWIDEMIALYIEKAFEDETFHDKKISFLRRFVEIFPETREDILFDIKLELARSLFDQSSIPACDAFEKLAGEYFYKSEVYEAWSEAYCSDGVCCETARDLENAERIVETGLFAGVDDPRGLLEKLLILREMRLEEEIGRPGPLTEGLERAEKWEDKFRRSPLSEKITLLSQASESGAAREMLCYIDIAGLFVAAFKSAISSNKNAEFFELLCRLKANRRELYLVFSNIIDNFIISYHISKGEFDRALNAASEFCLKTGSNQVLTAGVIEKFLLCSETKDAIWLAERTAEKRWSEIIDRFRIRLGHLILSYDMQREYVKLKNGGALPQAEKLEKFSIYGKIFKAEEIESALERLRGSFAFSGARPDRTELEKLHMLPREKYLVCLTQDFAAFMFEKNGVDFPVSHVLWSRFLEFIETGREDIFGPTPAAKLFSFSSDRLKKQVKASAESDFFAFEEIAPVMAGGTFIYEYLFESGIIDAAFCDRSTRFFSDMRKYAAGKYPGKMWALEHISSLKK